ARQGSGDDSDLLRKTLPASAVERGVDLENHLLQFVFPGEEVRGNPDTSPYSIVDQDVPGEKVLGHLVPVRHIQSDGSTALPRIPRRKHSIAARIRQLY